MKARGQDATSYDESIQFNYCDFWYHIKCAWEIMALSNY